MITAAQRDPTTRWLTTAAVAAAIMLTGAARPADAASIAVHQDVLTSTIVKRLFTDNGRRMLTGSVASCNYAYIERPQVTLRDGRLYLRMHTRAQAGISLGGACQGAGDAFSTTVSGQPYVAGDGIGIRDFRLEEGRDAYRGLLDPLLRRTIPQLLGVNVRDELTKMFQAHAPEYRITMSQLQLQDATAREGYLTVRFDFALVANESRAQ